VNRSTLIVRGIRDLVGSDGTLKWPLPRPAASTHIEVT